MSETTLCHMMSGSDIDGLYANIEPVRSTQVLHRSELASIWLCLRPHIGWMGT